MPYYLWDVPTPQAAAGYTEQYRQRQHQTTKQNTRKGLATSTWGKPHTAWGRLLQVAFQKRRVKKQRHAGQRAKLRSSCQVAAQGHVGEVGSEQGAAAGIEAGVL